MNQYPAKPLMDEMAQYGRYGDSMLVHMNPIEVAGIASLSPTGQLTTNPVTGQPEAFLPLLPIIAGIGIKSLGLGALATGALTGVATAAITGDLKRGLISGLTAGVAGGIADLGAEAAQASTDVLTTGAEIGTTGVDIASQAADASTLASDIASFADSPVTGLTAEGVRNVAGLGADTLTGLTPDQMASSIGSVYQPIESALPAGFDTAAAVGNVSPEPFDFMTYTPEFIEGMNPMQATALAGMGAGQLAQMDVEDDLAAQAAAREAEREEKLAQAYGDLYGAQMAAQPGLSMGMSPRRSIMSNIIPYRPTMGMSAGGSTSLPPYLQDLVDRGVLTEEQARDQMEARGDAAQNEDLEQVTDVAQGTDTQGAGAGTNVYDRHDDILDDEDLDTPSDINNSEPEGAGNNPDYVPPDTETETETETTTTRPVTRENTPMEDIGFLGREEEILNKAKMGNVLTQEEQAILERYYNRYENYRRRRDARFKKMDRENANFVDYQALANAAGGAFGFVPGGGIGLDPVSVQAGLRGEYAVAPPKDYMTGFEPEFSYFQNDPNAPFIPDRGYRPISGGIESSGGYFDPILDREEYNRQLMDYYTMLGSYMPGAVEYPEEPGSIEDDPDTVGTTPIGGGAGETPDVGEPVDVEPEDPEEGEKPDVGKPIGVYAHKYKKWRKNSDFILDKVRRGVPLTDSEQEWYKKYEAGLIVDPRVRPEGFQVPASYEDAMALFESGGYEGVQTVSFGELDDYDRGDEEQYPKPQTDGESGTAISQADLLARAELAKDARDQMKGIRALLGGKEGMKGILGGVLSGDSELARQHQEEKARYLPPQGSAAYNRLSPEEQEAIDMERDRRQQAAQRQRREYLESVGGYGNYEGGFNDADYWNAGYANLDDAYYYDGQIKPASETTTSVEMPDGVTFSQDPMASSRSYVEGLFERGVIDEQGNLLNPEGVNIATIARGTAGFLDLLPEDVAANLRAQAQAAMDEGQGGSRSGGQELTFAEGGQTEVAIRTPMGEATVPAGGIANMPTEFSASMPTEQEFNMLISAIAGQADNADQIIEMFIERYGVDMFSQIREMVLQSIVPNAQTEGMIEGNGSGMDDMVGGMIGDQQPVAVSPGEYIVPADVVSGLGDGSSDAGAEELDQMMSRVRMARGGTTEQAPPIDARRMMPA